MSIDRCGACGTEITPADKFCMYCGILLKRKPLPSERRGPLPNKKRLFDNDNIIAMPYEEPKITPLSQSSEEKLDKLVEMVGEAFGLSNEHPAIKEHDRYLERVAVVAQKPMAAIKQGSKRLVPPQKPEPRQTSMYGGSGLFRSEDAEKYMSKKKPPMVKPAELTSIHRSHNFLPIRGVLFIVIIVSFLTTLLLAPAV